MSRIHRLDPSLINKIAAGEVVERPASVVKELVENAIDAGATQVFVTVENGGRDKISVLDNGSGMTREEAHLCIERHATSKIQTLDDLFAIRTLGFRGEALAAISAVSRFELTTCFDESIGGVQIRIQGGVEAGEIKLGFPRGTRITVEDLFFNVPARLKFLKTLKTEVGHIQDEVMAQALAHPEIQFRLTHNKQMMLNLGPDESFASRVQSCFGKEVAKDLLWLEHAESYLQFQGLVSNPTGGTRPQKRHQWLFLNGRAVRCKEVTHAVYEGFKTLLMKNMHPMFFLHLTLDPAELDVNVHPAKAEARLKNPALVSTILSMAIQRGLKRESRKEFFGELPTGTNNGNGVKEFPHHQPLKEQLPRGLFAEVSEQIGFRTAVRPSPPKPMAPVVPQPAPAANPQPASPAKPSAPPPEASPFSFQPSAAAEAQPLAPQQHLSLIGQLDQKYLLAAGEAALVLVDQHAAHERIRFEEIRTQFYGQGIATEKLLIPLLLELPPQEGLLLEQHLEDWAKLGFSIEPFGGRDYRISGIPSLLKHQDAGAIIKAVLDELNRFGRSGKLELFFNEAFEKMACHSAIRAGQALSGEEMQALLNQLAGLDLSLHCPHGRPVLVKIGLDELDKRFKRLV